MKIIRDPNVCEAHGECILVAPELFDLGDDTGAVVLLNDSPGPELHDKARHAEKVCPLGAITVIEE